MSVNTLPISATDSQSSRCKVCTGEIVFAFTGTVLGKYKAEYLFCRRCGYLFAHAPSWVSESYDEAISALDTGLVQRNLNLTMRLTDVFVHAFEPNSRFLDFAGGSGLLVRLLRDAGIDCYWHDRYAKNILANGFDFVSDATARPPSAVTAIEVFEHAEDPSALMADILHNGCRTIIFTTTLHGGTVPPIDWWYYSFETGQHISFYCAETLRLLGKSFGLHYTSKDGLHLFTDNLALAEHWQDIASIEHCQRFLAAAQRQLTSKT